MYNVCTRIILMAMFRFLPTNSLQSFELKINNDDIRETVIIKIN